MTTMQINGSEQGNLRLFQIDLPPEDVDTFATPTDTGEWPLQAALGASHLREAFAEVISVRDLEPMTLSAYLVEAHDVQGADFASDRARIDALRGYVLILSSPAFDRQSQTLSIRAPLRWIGTYAETVPAGALPSTGTPETGTIGQTSQDQGSGTSRVLRAVLLVLALVVVLVIGLIVM